MAECPLATGRVQYQGRWAQSNSALSSRNISFRMSKRNYILLPGLSKSSSAIELKRRAFSSVGFHGKGYRIETVAKCYYLQSLIGSESMVSPNLMLFSDEALLSISIVFAYLAGVVPSQQAVPRTRIPNANKELTEPTSSDSGRNVECLPETNTGFDPNITWNEVRAKLSEFIEANGQDASMDSTEGELKNDTRNYPLSMLAIHDGPRLRLLLITFQLLEMEARNVSESSELLDGVRWSQVSTVLLDGLIEQAFMKWIEEEQTLENVKSDEKFMKTISRKVKEDAGTLKRFNRLGKSELYMDLLFFLIFGSPRSDGYFDAKFLVQHGARILEDLVIFVADMIASIYLELMSVDGDMPTEVVGSSLALCSLSTRELQKQRNEVAIKGWFHQYFESVTSMYEDRFELYILCRRECENQVKNQAAITNWWNLAFGMSSTATPLDYVYISPFSLPVRRTKELRALTGWRYYYSLFLEMSDISMPFLRAVVARVSAAVSYFWVTMIGRSLGLIFSGIRQSIGWK